MNYNVSQISAICSMANVRKKMVFDASSFKLNHRLTEGDVRCVLEAVDGFHNSQDNIERNDSAELKCPGCGNRMQPQLVCNNCGDYKSINSLPCGENNMSKVKIALIRLHGAVAGMPGSAVVGDKLDATSKAIAQL